MGGKRKEANKLLFVAIWILIPYCIHVLLYYSITEKLGEVFVDDTSFCVLRMKMWKLKVYDWIESFTYSLIHIVT
jgi:hypothetical protein